jgi:hypothetical protein
MSPQGFMRFFLRQVFAQRDDDMKPFLPRKYEHIAFGLLLSGMMSFLVSGFATLIAIGLSTEFPLQWLKAWLPSWALAFPVVLIVAPFVRRLLSSIVIRD